MSLSLSFNNIQVPTHEIRWTILWLINRIPNIQSNVPFTEETSRIPCNGQMILNTLIFNGSKDQTYVENSRSKCALPIILFSSKKNWFKSIRIWTWYSQGPRLSSPDGRNQCRKTEHFINLMSNMTQSPQTTEKTGRTYRPR